MIDKIKDQVGDGVGSASPRRTIKQDLRCKPIILGAQNERLCFMRLDMSIKRLPSTRKWFLTQSIK
jgi:hypothetical protein